MATVPFEVPDDLVSDLVAALAMRQGVEPPTEAPAMIALAQAFIHEQLGQALLDYKAQIAARAARENESDPAVAWARAATKAPEAEPEPEPVEPPISATPARRMTATPHKARAL